jgi:phosphoribosylformimino-5-aminoimidazole carboxamide ribotide isomerase
LEIIPVIDLLDGRVVHARRGERQHYQPIQSSLCNSSEPLDVLQALLELYPFDQLYIADLNGIQKRGNHYDAIIGIRDLYPDLELWLDCGFSDVADLEDWRDSGVNFVIGSESLNNMESYTALQLACLELTCKQNQILSLDFTASGYQGPVELLQNPVHWPDKVIAMTLSQVGSNLGPDEDKLASIIQRSNGSKIYAAGGIRDMADLLKLKNMHVSGALVATALHSGALTGTEIANLATP